MRIRRRVTEGAGAFKTKPSTDQTSYGRRTRTGHNHQPIFHINQTIHPIHEERLNPRIAGGVAARPLSPAFSAAELFGCALAHREQNKTSNRTARRVEGLGGRAGAGVRTGGWRRDRREMPGWRSASGGAEMAMERSDTARKSRRSAATAGSRAPRRGWARRLG